MTESEEEHKSLLMKVQEASENVGLKLSRQKTKIMASGPITSWEIDGEQWKQYQTLFFGAPKSLQMVIVAMILKDAYSLTSNKKYFANFFPLHLSATLLFGFLIFQSAVSLETFFLPRFVSAMPR